MDSAWACWSGQLSFVSDCLARHKESIESFAEMLPTFKKKIDFLSQEVHIRSGTNENGSVDCATKNENEDGNSRGKANPPETLTIEILLETIQTSFRSEREMLQMTFRKLEESFEVSKVTFNQDSLRNGIHTPGHKSDSTSMRKLKYWGKPSEKKRIIDDTLGQLNDKRRENEDLKREVQKLCQTVSRIEAEKTSLQSEIESLKSENERLKLEVTKIPSDMRSSGQEANVVQLYYQKSGEQVAMVVQEVMSLLNADKRLGNKKLTFTLCGHLTDIQAKSPLLVLCFNTSGIATDVMNALKGIPQSGNTAILIFHHKDEYALPNLSSLRVIVNPDFQNYGGIFDMAFLAGKGIYRCKMNTDALNGVMEFLKMILGDNIV